MRLFALLLTVLPGIALPEQAFAQSAAPATCASGDCAPGMIDVPRRRHRRRRTTLYAGGPVPIGYHVVRRDRGLTGMGIGVFLFGYTPSFVIGTIGALGRSPLQWSLIPFVGLSVTAVTCLEDAICRPTGALALALGIGAGLSTVAQMAGLIVTIVGLSSPRYLVPYVLGPNGFTRRAIEWNIAPWATAGSAGVALTVVAL